MLLVAFALQNRLLQLKLRPTEIMCRNDVSLIRSYRSTVIDSGNKINFSFSALFKRKKIIKEKADRG